MTFFLTAFAVVVTCGFLLFVFTLVRRIMFPTVYEYEWPESSNPTTDKEMIVLMGGSFNPPHLGHIEMIRYLAARYNKVFIVVGHNPNKSYAVTPDDRVALLKTCLGDLPNVTVRAVGGYIWRHVPEAQIFFRGIRTWEKDGAEERSLAILNTWGPMLLGPCWWPRKTVYLQGNPKYNHISSTLIRDILSSGRSEQGEDVESALAQLVPEVIVSRVKQLYAATEKTESSKEK